MQVNINKKVVDPFYRYKMPKLIIQGSGYNTTVMNINDVSKALGRPSEYLMKFFAFELGVPVRESNLKGHHDQIKLSKLVDSFIEKFVICKSCSNPETDIILKEKGSKGKEIFLSCVACGNVSRISINHKLCNFIEKNPPSPSNSQSSMYLGSLNQTPLFD